MYLKSLELNGFKSFGKKSVLEFNTPITAIVGPNGSGKSNVAEAFRFVLGEQSLKSMRGKKGEDMIFNGSNEAQRQNRAGVKLIFDNHKRFLNIDFDEVVIERVVFRDGSNEYLINGSKVRLKDVVELLSGANIGSSGHHIISQGEADRILHANPKEKREMIEDALGIKIFQYKKEESEKKLQKTEENMKQVESLRREIAPHLKFLRKQVEKLEKAEEIKSELVSLARVYFKKESVYIENKKEEILNKKKGPELELRTLDIKLQELKRMVQSSLGNNKDEPEIIEIERRLESLRLEKDNLMRDLGKIEGEISYIRKSIQKEEFAIREEDKKQVFLKDVEIMEKSVAQIVSDSSKVEDINSLRDFIRKIQDVIRSFVLNNKENISIDTLTVLNNDLNRLENQEKNFSQKLLEQKQIEESLIASYEEKRKEIERAKDETREAEKDIFRIVAKQNEVHAILDRLKTEERQVFYDEETFKNDLSELSSVGGVEILKFSNEYIDYEQEDRGLQFERKKHLERLKIRLEESGVVGGDDILKEYKDTEDRDQFLARELIDLEKSKEDTEKLITELSERLDTEFKEGVKKINNEFNNFFTLMFGGGSASLRLFKQEKRKRNQEDESEETDDLSKDLEEGLEVEVSLPHKKIKGLMMLSGGERALTSIALLFAISQVNPPPFIILDETDAALDEANSRKYGDMVENLAKHSELIVITHNRETMSRAGVLYGVTMGKDAVSKLLSISFKEAEAVAK